VLGVGSRGAQLENGGCHPSKPAKKWDDLGNDPTREQVSRHTRRERKKSRLSEGVIGGRTIANSHGASALGKKDSNRKQQGEIMNDEQ